MSQPTQSPLVGSNGQPLGPSQSLKEQQKLKARRDEQHTAWHAYRGRMPDELQSEPGEANVNVKSNRMGTIVDTRTFYLFGQVLAMEVDADTPRADDAQEALDNLWGGDDDAKMTLLSKLRQNGGVFGHVYSKLIPPDEKAGLPYAKIVPLDPMQVTVETDPEDVDVVTCYRIEWETTDAKGNVFTRRQEHRRVDPDGDDAADDLPDGGTDTSWTITDFEKSGGATDIGGGQWIQLGEPEVWPHSWSAIVDWQNLPLANEHDGIQDIPPDLIQLNRALNFNLTNVNKIGRTFGHPWVYATGINSQQTIDNTPGKVIKLPAPDAKMATLSASGDLPGLMQFAADLRLDMDEQSHVPGVATGRMTEMLKGNTSGVALRMLYMPLLSVVTFMRRTYGAGIKELNRRGLALMQFGDGTLAGGVKTDLKWQDPLPADDLMAAQAAIQWLQVGASKRTLLQRGNFDPDVEEQNNQDADAQQMRNMLAGQAIPQPPDPNNPDPNAPPSADPNAPPQPGQPAQPGQPGVAPNGQTPPVNHPAAVAARAKMQAAFGKTPGGQ